MTCSELPPLYIAPIKYFDPPDAAKIGAENRIICHSPGLFLLGPAFGPEGLVVDTPVLHRKNEARTDTASCPAYCRIVTQAVTGWLQQNSYQATRYISHAQVHGLPLLPAAEQTLLPIQQPPMRICARPSSLTAVRRYGHCAGHSGWSGAAGEHQSPGPREPTGSPQLPACQAAGSEAGPCKHSSIKGNICTAPMLPGLMASQCARKCVHQGSQPGRLRGHSVMQAASS